MTRASDPPVDADPPDASLDAELGRILEAYLADLEAGRPVDPEQLLAEHPSLASQLRSCLAVVNLADRVADGTGPGTGDGRAAGSDAMVMPMAASVLSTWNRRNGPPPHVHLHDLADDDDPLVRPGSPAMPATPEGSWGRYQLQGEIARGGMGAVIKGRDVDLGRDLAIKVLLEAHRDDPDVVRRFVEEAQIGGQLQHPGIVPVYELGTCADRRPYFAMKLVRGRTLASLLQARAVRPDPSPVGAGSVRRSDRDGRGTEPPPTGIHPPTGGFPTHDELPRFLSIFEQICQTIAYAHARGVIHRDLKPTNVMVGSFGEVQVMDWGLAKVLARGGLADEATAGAEPLGETVIMTVRSGPAGSGSDSQAGSVLGTPAYMSPEQARGDVERLDERVDVFGLGAILCEVLTGRPPFTGTTREEVRDRAARGDLADALNRIELCRADTELVALAKDSLAAEPERRPRDAGEVSRRMTAYQVGVQDRLKAAELARVEAQTRVEEERKRQMVTVALAASVLGLVLLGGGGWAYLMRQRAERLAVTTRVVTDALAEAERIRGQAQEAVGDLSKWAAAVSAARQARVLLAEGESDALLRSRVHAVLTDLEQEQAMAGRRVAEVERDQRLLGELEAIRASRGEHLVPKRSDTEYAAAFRRFGIDPDQLDPKEAGKQIAQRSNPVELSTFLDDWAVVRRMAGDQKNEAPWRRILAVSQVSDPDPWRAVVREQMGGKDRETLRRLADDQTALESQPASSLVLLAGSLKAQDDSDRAEQVLRQAWGLAPGDFWVNIARADLQWRNGRHTRPEDAIRFYATAVAIRSRSSAVHNNLGTALMELGKLDEAIAQYRDALRLKPEHEAACMVHDNLGNALRARGKLDEAITEHRAALRLKPDHANAHNNLGVALRDQGKLDEAIGEYRAALRLKPDHANAHNNLGVALGVQGKRDEAITEFREALRLKPGDAEIHTNLGAALAEQGKPDAAIAEFREALRLKPGDAEIHTNLGAALAEQGKPDAAIAEFREALRLKPGYAEAHTNLGAALAEQGKPDAAIAEFREALRLKPGDAEIHTNLGAALAEQGKPDAAIAEFREALRLKPDHPRTHCNLGHLMMQQGRYKEALAEVKQGHELGSKSPNWRYPSARWVREAERFVELEKRLPEFVAGRAKTADAADSLTVAQMCYDRKLHGASARIWDEAFQSQPKLGDDMQAQHRYNAACAAALAGCGQGKGDPPPDDATKTRWRKQAIDWLKADVSAWSNILESGPAQARAFIAQTLQHWKIDPDLAGVRDEAALAKLPDDEQKACRALWVEVDTLLKKAGDTKP